MGSLASRVGVHTLPTSVAATGASLTGTFQQFAECDGIGVGLTDRSRDAWRRAELTPNQSAKLKQGDVLIVGTTRLEVCFPDDVADAGNANNENAST